MTDNIYRILDANANRLREALRVCEDITRFILADRRATQKFKSLRHRTIFAIKKIDRSGRILAKSRDAENDIGKKTTKSESRRENIPDIFKANIKRAEESVRVLEEFSKLLRPAAADRFKRIRFELYTLEKSVIKKL